MEFYVYTLSRPDGSVFYVGKGKGKRIRQHEWEAEGGCACYKCKVIRKVWREGGNIEKSIVFETNDEQAAFAYEIELIRFYGRDNLVNHTDGGEGQSGRVMSPESRAKIGKASRERGGPVQRVFNAALARWRGSKHKPDTIARMSQIAQSRDAEWEANRRAALRAQQEQRRNADPAYQLMFDLLSQGVHPEDVVEMTGLSIRTVYRWKKEWGL